VAEPGAVAETIAGRYGDVVDRISLYANYELDRSIRAEIIDSLREQTAHR
jgi:hypothetical protein